MHHIDRYELSLTGHQRLVDALVASHGLRDLVDLDVSANARTAMRKQLQTLTQALTDAVDNCRPVDGLNAFLHQAGERDFVSLSPRECEALHEVRCCNEEGIKDIFKMIRRTANQKPRPCPDE